MDYSKYSINELMDSPDNIDKEANIWSISVNGNWRVTFEFKDGNAYILNYEDYH